MTALKIRAMLPADVPCVVAIQSEAPGIAQWTVSDYEALARGEMAGWVAQGDGGVLGFIVARRLVDEIEILNLAVASSARRRGIASQLLAAALAWGAAAGASRAILEVRASNRPAVQLYARHNFAVEGRRRLYYRAPPEDALLLGRSLAAQRASAGVTAHGGAQPERSRR